MSGMMLADFDRDVGCCSCLGFLRKGGREMDSFTGGDQFDREFLLDGALDGPNGYLCEGFQKFTALPGKNRVICREKPVKETTHLMRGEDADGHKMINEYVRECNIGHGSYGKVVLYRSNNDGKRYAIKAFYKSRLSKVRVTPSETAMTDVRREVSIMKLLEHPNLINLVEVIDDSESDHFYMVLEYVEGKWVCDASGTCGGIGENTARRYFRDIIAGLIYLHAHDIVHGDIKPENLLVTRSLRVKIGDFSVSQSFEDCNDELWRSPGTPVFTAPECCLGLTYHGKAADVWALGVTLYCMILGNCPFIGDCLQDTYDKIVNNPLYIPEEVDPELKDLLQGLLCKDPRRRLTLDSAAEHPWVVREGGSITRASCRCKSDSIREDNSSVGAKIDMKAHANSSSGSPRAHLNQAITWGLSLYAPLHDSNRNPRILQLGFSLGREVEICVYFTEHKQPEKRKSLDGNAATTSNIITTTLSIESASASKRKSLVDASLITVRVITALP